MGLYDTKDVVVLDLKTYNTQKNAAVKANLVIDRLFELAKLSEESCSLTFNNNAELTDLLELAYPERFKNRVKELKEEK